MARATKKTRSPARKPSRRSPATKGQHGGARPGAGRPRERLPEEMLAELGPAPDDPLEVDGWYRRAIAAVQFGVFRGKPWATMLRDLNKSAATSSKLVNAELQAEIVKLKKREKELAEGGAALTPRSDAQRTGAVRRAPG